MDFFKSKQTLHRYPTDFLIGDLLVKAGVISQSKLDEAIKLSGAKHLQLGQMLIMGGSINAFQLQAAVDAQSLVRDRSIDLNEALKVLKQACKSGPIDRRGYLFRFNEVSCRSTTEGSAFRSERSAPRRA